MKQKLLGIFLFLSILVTAQQYYDDAKARMSIGLEKKISKKLSLRLQQQDRWDKNLSRYYRGSLDVGISYKITPNIKLEADYVYIQRRKKTDRFTARHWTSVDVVFKKEVRRFSFLYRNMLQARFKEPGTAKDSYIARWYDRNKLTVKYQLSKRFEMFVAEEIYIPLNSPLVKGPERSRSIIGTDIKTFRHQELELYFMYQLQLQKDNWYKLSDKYQYPYMNRDFIYGLSYTFTF
jgi:hypothetical protein